MTAEFYHVISKMKNKFTCKKPSMETDWTVFPRPISSAKITFVSFLQLAHERETN